MVVIRVDKDKGYIDLSKRRVNPEDVERCTEFFSKAKVNLIENNYVFLINTSSKEKISEPHPTKLFIFHIKPK